MGTKQTDPRSHAFEARCALRTAGATATCVQCPEVQQTTCEFPGSRLNS